MVSAQDAVDLFPMAEIQDPGFCVTDEAAAQLISAWFIRIPPETVVTTL